MYDPNIDRVFNESIIWRYMDFWKFAYLIKNRALYFTRVDTLADPFEGKLPPANVETIAEGLKRYNIPQEKINKLVRLQNSDRNNYYVNCWCMKDYESNLMWDAYTTNNTAVAIQSTDKMLINSFNKKDKVQLCGIEYIDWKTVEIPNNHTHSQIAHKSKFYEDERELRAFLMKFVPVQGKKDLVWGGMAPPEKGLFVKVNLDSLIEEVVVKKEAPLGFEDLVADVMGKYGVNKPVKR